MVSNWQEEFCINLLKLASRGNEESYKLALQIHSMSSSFNQKSNFVFISARVVNTTIRVFLFTYNNFSKIFSDRTFQHSQIYVGD